MILGVHCQVIVAEHAAFRKSHMNGTWSALKGAGLFCKVCNVRAFKITLKFVFATYIKILQGISDINIENDQLTGG